MTNKRIRTYWLVLLVMLMAVNMVLSVEPTQAHYVNTMVWNTVVEAEENAVTSDCLAKVSGAPLTVLVGEIPMEEYSVSFKLHSSKDTSGVLSWRVDKPDYLLIFTSIGDKVVESGDVVELKAGSTETVTMLLVPTQEARVTAQEPRTLNITVKWADSLKGKFRVTLPIHEEPLPEESTVPSVPEGETEPTTETTANPSVEPTTESTAEPTTETTTESTAESTTESTAESTTETTTEATVASTTKVTTESLTGPTVPQLTPTSEPATEPVTVASDEGNMNAVLTEEMLRMANRAVLNVKENEILAEQTEIVTVPTVPQLPVASEPETEPASVMAEEIDEQILLAENAEQLTEQGSEIPTEQTDPTAEPTETEPTETEPTATEPITTEPSTEPVDPASGEDVEKFELKTIYGYIPGEKLPVKLYVTEEITKAKLGMGDGGTKIGKFPKYTCYSLDQGASYYLMYHDDTITLTPGTGSSLPVLLDFSRVDLGEASNIVLAAEGYAEDQSVGQVSTTAAVIAEPIVPYQMDNQFLTRGSSMTLTLDEKLKAYEFSYSVERLSLHPEEEKQSEKQLDTPEYIEVDASEWSNFILDEENYKLTFQVDAILPQAGTYRVNLNWTYEGICFTEEQATFFINYSVYSESEGTGGTEQ